jgi:gliding motility-associated lipoprotein GldH
LFGVGSSLRRSISKAPALRQAKRLAFNTDVGWSLRQTTGFAILFLFLTACTFEETYFAFQSVPDSQWDKQEELRFEVPITDISTPYKITLELRNNDKYAYRNLCVLVDCQIPDGGLWLSDSVNVKLANKTGKWYGKGIALYEYSTPYRSNVQYPDTGTYIYTIRHGMKENLLNGISDVGLRIEPQN